MTHIVRFDSTGITNLSIVILHHRSQKKKVCIMLACIMLSSSAIISVHPGAELRAAIIKVHPGAGLRPSNGGQMNTLHWEKISGNLYLQLYTYC